MADKKNKSKVISFRLTEEQYKPFEELLNKSDKSYSEFFRELFLSRQKNVNIIFNENKPIDYYSILRVVNKSGNNINQLAKHFNVANKNGKMTDDLYKKGVNLLINISEYLKGSLKDDS